MPDSAATTFGKINVIAPASGVISTLDKQQIGDYVLEGDSYAPLPKAMPSRLP